MVTGYSTPFNKTVQSTVVVNVQADAQDYLLLSRDKIGLAYRACRKPPVPATTISIKVNRPQGWTSLMRTRAEIESQLHYALAVDAKAILRRDWGEKSR